MAQGLHTGKIVLNTGQGAQIRRDGSYLVTGGLGAIGLEVGRWLCEAGAGRVVLASRRPPTAEVEKRIEAWRANGAVEGVSGLGSGRRPSRRGMDPAA